MANKISEKCPICLEELSSSRDRIITSCSHVFDDVCFKQVIDASDKDFSYVKCPICRKELDVFLGDVTKIPAKERIDYIPDTLISSFIKEYIQENDYADVTCNDIKDELKMLYERENRVLDDTIFTDLCAKELVQIGGKKRYTIKRLPRG